MKVYAISDWHLSINNPKPMDIFGGAWDNYINVMSNNLEKVLTDDDILLIAGDISWAMLLDQARPDLKFISKFKGKKVIIRGNHDYWWKSITAVRDACGHGTYALQNDSIRLGNIVIAGTRLWQEPDKDDEHEQKIFNREVLRLKMSLDDAKQKMQDGDKLIVMTHYPPFHFKKDSIVTRLIAEYNPYAVVYGHIHGSNYRFKQTELIGGTPYYLTSCDILKNDPLLIVE